MREGTARVRRVGDGWEYLDGSCWPTLDALRDHVLSRARADVGLPSSVPNSIRRMLA